MKKILTITITIFFSIFLISCGGNKETSKNISTSSNAKNISIEESKNLIDNNEVKLIVDVRDEKQFKEGHLPNAILIPYKEVKEKISDISEFKDKPILIYCNSGKKSADAIKILEDNGFNQIYHMIDGISKWTYDIEQ